MLLIQNAIWFKPKLKLPIYPAKPQPVKEETRKKTKTNLTWFVHSYLQWAYDFFKE